MKTPQTPMPKIAAGLGLSEEVWFKREDKHHYGSHKGRAVPLMIAAHHKIGVTQFVISSSGNAALAAILAVRAHNKNKPEDQIRLQVFIGNEIDADKKQLLTAECAGDETIIIEQVADPKPAALRYEKTRGATWLRQSTDATALLGYVELAKELAKIDRLAAVFVPTSSGTTAAGLALGFGELGLIPEIHVVQTTACHPIADAINPAVKNIPPAPSLAGAIVDKVAHRKVAVAAAVRASGGWGWVIDNAAIIAAEQLVKKTTDLDISPNSALSVAGLTAAHQSGRTWPGPVVCLITGR